MLWLKSYRDKVTCFFLEWVLSEKKMNVKEKKAINEKEKEKIKDEWRKRKEKLK